MNTARIVVLVIALGAGGGAAYLASGYDSKPAPSAAPAAAQLPTTEILVAKSDIGLGQIVKPEDLQWQTWPASAASSAFIRRDGRPEAMTQIAGSIVRFPIMQGEPVREHLVV
jgi:pilus assembly protein CpaB